MKIIILAGGFGTRISEYSESMPKPMVPIGGKPILVHIMEIYASQGYKDFIIALGYKSDYIKEYFLNYYSKSSDFSIDMRTGDIAYINNPSIDWNISLIDTGLDTMTGGRIGRLKDIIGNEAFMVTYGDAVANVNLTNLVKHHTKSGCTATVTAVRPVARFGELGLDGSVVKSFAEKAQINSGWINGGFFVFEPEVFTLLEQDEIVLEKKPLETLALEGNLSAYFHEGFWQCMDTKRERDNLDKMCVENNMVWKNIKN